MPTFELEYQYRGVRPTIALAKALSLVAPALERVLGPERVAEIPMAIAERLISYRMRIKRAPRARAWGPWLPLPRRRRT